MISFFGQLEKPASAVTVRHLLPWVLLCIVMPMLSIVGSETWNAGFMPVFPRIIVVYCVASLAVIAAKCSNRIVEMVFWLYVCILMAIRAFSKASAKHFSWAEHNSNIVIAALRVRQWRRLRNRCPSFQVRAKGEHPC